MTLQLFLSLKLGFYTVFTVLLIPRGTTINSRWACFTMIQHRGIFRNVLCYLGMTPNPHTPRGWGGCLGKIPENVKTFRKKCKKRCRRKFWDFRYYFRIFATGKAFLKYIFASKIQKISPPAARFTPRIDYSSFVILSQMNGYWTVLIAKF